MGRYYDFRYVQFSRQRACVHGAASTEGNHGKIPGVIPPVDGNQLQCIDHIVVGNADHPARRFLRLHPCLCPETGQRRAYCACIRLHTSTDKVVGVDTLQQQVGVRRGRFRATPVIGYRARHGAGAAGSDVHPAVFIDPTDRTAAVADLDDVDDRRHHRITTGKIASLHHVTVRCRDPAVVEQRAFGGGAADVESDDIFNAQQFTQGRRAQHAARRPRFHDCNGCFPHRIDRINAAVRAHDVKRS